jgi:hypothetical protein
MPRIARPNLLKLQRYALAAELAQQAIVGVSRSGLARDVAELTARCRDKRLSLLTLRPRI